VVTNVNNGDSATGLTWIYRVLKPIIVSVTTTQVLLGGNATVTVANAVGFPRITIGGLGANITSQTDNGNGTTTFVIQVPSTLPLTSQACTGISGATALQPTAFDVTYTSLTTGCSDTLSKGLTVAPPQTPILFLSPNGFAPFTATITPADLTTTPPTPASVASPPAQTVLIVDTGAAPLHITSVTQSGAGCGSGPGQIFVSAPVAPPTQTLNTCDSAPITAHYTGTTAPSSAQCTVTIISDDPNRSPKVLQLSGSSQ
jgi:hypothetical protein